MPTQRNFTVEDTSPLIQYTPAANWSPGTSGDTEKSFYSMGTFQLSTVRGSNATFSFNGTSVWIYGAKRSNHGPYAGTIDGVTSPQQDGFSATDALQQVLYSATGLTQGPHTVTITNEEVDTAAPFLDVDYIIYESAVADDSTVIFDDTNPQIQYNPPGVWNIDGCFNVGTYFGSSCHITSASSASVALNFQGDSITVYGGVGPQYGPYTVNLDNRPAVQLTANSSANIAPIILYSATSLGPGNHTVTLTNNPASVGQVLDVDHFLITGNAATGASGTYFPPPKASVQPGPIVGAAIGAIALCCAVFALLWFLVLRHRQPKRRPSLDIDGPKETHMEYGVTPFTLNMQNDSTAANTSDFDPNTMGMPQVIPANAVGRTITGYSVPVTLPEQPDSPPAGLRGGSVARYTHQSQTSLSNTYTSGGPTETSSGIPGIAPISAVAGEKGRLARPTVQNNSDLGTPVQRLTSPGAESNFADAPPSYS